MIDARQANPIRIYESNLTLVGEIDDYSSAYFTRSWHGIGDFAIQTNFNTVHATDLQKGRIVMFGKDNYRVGIITKLDKALDENGKGGQIVTASGFEIKFVFSHRIVLPQTSSAVYTLYDSAETVMKTLVKDQCGSTADADRQFPGLTIATDSGRGANYLLNTRYNSTVADELQKASMATGVGYYVYIDEANADYVFEIGLGVDRTATQSTNPRAIFSDNYDTIQRAKFSTSDNQYRNYAYAAGQGVGTGRTVREVYSTATEPTGFDRKEIFVDARDVTANADIDLRGSQKLGEYNIQTTVDGMPLTYSPLVYRVDYDLGDMVTVDVYDTPYDARVTSVKESWAPLQYSVELTFDKEPASLPTQVNRASEASRATSMQTEGVVISSGGDDAAFGGRWEKSSNRKLEQWGWGYAQGDGTNTAEEVTITYQVAFSSIEEMVVTCIGAKTGSNPSSIEDLTTATNVWGNARSVGKTTVIARVNALGAMGSTTRYGFSWHATGKY